MTKQKARTPQILNFRFSSVSSIDSSPTKCLAAEIVQKFSTKQKDVDNQLTHLIHFQFHEKLSVYFVQIQWQMSMHNSLKFYSFPSLISPPKHSKRHLFTTSGRYIPLRLSNIHDNQYECAHVFVYSNICVRSSELI